MKNRSFALSPAARYRTPSQSSREPSPIYSKAMNTSDIQDLLQDIQEQHHSTSILEKRVHKLEERFSHGSRSPSRGQPSQSESYSYQNQHFRHKFVTPVSKPQLPPKQGNPVRALPLSDKTRLTVNLKDVAKPNVQWLNHKDQKDYIKSLTHRSKSNLRGSSLDRFQSFNKENSQSCNSTVILPYNEEVESMQNAISNIRGILKQKRMKLQSPCSRKYLEERYYELVRAIEEITHKLDQARYSNILLEGELNEIRLAKKSESLYI